MVFQGCGSRRIPTLLLFVLLRDSVRVVDDVEAIGAEARLPHAQKTEHSHQVTSLWQVPVLALPDKRSQSGMARVPVLTGHIDDAVALVWNSTYSVVSPLSLSGPSDSPDTLINNEFSTFQCTCDCPVTTTRTGTCQRQPSADECASGPIMDVVTGPKHWHRDNTGSRQRTKQQQSWT
jgi:hypothetical protein